MLRLMLLSSAIVPVFTGLIFYLQAALLNSTAGTSYPPVLWALVGAALLTAGSVIVDFLMTNNIEVKRVRPTPVGVDLDFYSVIGRHRILPVPWSLLRKTSGFRRRGDYVLLFQSNAAGPVRQAWVSRRQLLAICSHPDRPDWLAVLAPG